MKKIINSINIEKLLTTFLLCQPIVDLITSLTYRFLGVSATLGVLVKGLFLAVLIFFVFYKYKFKDRKVSTVFVVLFSLYEVIYLLVNVYFKSNIVLISELKNSVKAFFSPLVIVLLYDVLKNEKFNFKSRVFSYILVEYVVLIFIANITGTYFNTYIGDKVGSIGWFYAGNDIGAILICLFPILIFSFVKNFEFKYILFIFLAIHSILGIGTKVTALGLILIIFAALLLTNLNYIFKKNKLKFKKNLIAILIIVIFTSMLLPSSPIIKNIKIHYDIATGNSATNNTEIIDELVFSGRTAFKKETLKRYNNSNILQKTFGMGYVDKNNQEYKLVERDFYDIFFNHGIVGTILQLVVYVSIIVCMIKLVLNKKFTNLFRMNLQNYVISTGLMLCISFYSGHILLNPTVGIYFSTVLISSFFRIYNIFGQSFPKKKNNKITIMALHLKPGGIEKFISTTAKFLAKKYDVEIVSVYKYKKEEQIDIDKKIKVVYLLDEKYKSNKNKILSSLKNKEVINFVKELFVAVKIVYLKRNRMIKYIKRCDSSIIISTRIEHNLILSEYGNKNILKIATEHNYYSKKYSQKVLNSCSDVDYFVVSTDDQKEYYKELFTGINTKVVKIPFGLENIPRASSKLNNYNLIAIGRLSKEKGFDDLLIIFSQLLKKEKRFKLKIIGDGQEKNKLKEIVNLLKISKNVDFCGRKNSNEIMNELLNSSMLLMTSLTESFGIVLIEAMSCGVPCIIFDDAKGACEIIKENQNGYIVKNRDKELYVNKILEVFNNKKELKRIGKGAKEYSKNFSLERIECCWLDILE